LAYRKLPQNVQNLSPRGNINCLSMEASTGSHRRAWLRSLAPLVLCLCVYVVWPAQAFAKTLLRVVHAVPGVGAASIDITAGGKRLHLGTASFAGFSGFRSIPAGPISWTLSAPTG